MDDWPTIAIRFALYVDLMLLFGLAAFSLYTLGDDNRLSAIALRSWLAVTSCAGLILSMIGLAVTAAGMAGVGPLEVDRASIEAILSEIAIGLAWKIRMAMLAIALVSTIALFRRPRVGPIVVCLSSGVAIATLAWTGHGAVDEGDVGLIHLGADILHLGAAAIWVGALCGLLLLVCRRPAPTEDLELSYYALHRFATVGTVVVGTIIATGLVNAWLLVGPDKVLLLETNLYGQLLLGKLALFAAMLNLAAYNRFRLTPALKEGIAQGRPADTFVRLRRSVALESTCAMIILGLVAWLGTLEPPMSAS